MTTYLVMIPGDERAWEAAPETERQRVYGKHRAFAEALEARGHTKTGGAELVPSWEARSVRTVDGRTSVTDGPYAESVEQLTGFYLVESDDPDDLARCCGLLTDDGEPVVEIRALAGGGG